MYKTVVFIYVLLDHSIPLCRVMGQVFRSRERSIIMMSSVKVICHNCHVAHIYIYYNNAKCYKTQNIHFPREI